MAMTPQYVKHVEQIVFNVEKKLNNKDESYWFLNALAILFHLIKMELNGTFQIYKV